MDEWVDNWTLNTSLVNVSLELLVQTLNFSVHIVLSVQHLFVFYEMRASTTLFETGENQAKAKGQKQVDRNTQEQTCKIGPLQHEKHNRESSSIRQVRKQVSWAGNIAGQEGVAGSEMTGVSNMARTDRMN